MMLITAKVIKDGWITSRPWAVEYYQASNGKRVNKVTGYRTKKQAQADVDEFHALPQQKVLG